MARTAGFVLNPKSKLTTDEQRVDELGILEEQVAALKKKLKRKGLLGKSIEGNLFTASIYGTHPTKLNPTKLLKLITSLGGTEEQLQACKVRSKKESICLRIKRKPVLKKSKL